MEATNHEVRLSRSYKRPCSGRREKRRVNRSQSPDGAAWTHYNSGRLLARGGNHDAAIPAYQECLRLEPGHVECHIALGHALLQIRDEETAAHSFGTALRLCPNDPEARFGLGVCLLIRGLQRRSRSSCRAARHAFYRILALDPHHVAAREGVNKA